MMHAKHFVNSLLPQAGEGLGMRVCKFSANFCDFDILLMKLLARVGQVLALISLPSPPTPLPLAGEGLTQ